MSEPAISLRAIIKDETAAQLQAMAENVKRVTQAIGAGSSATIAFVQAEKSLAPAVKEATEAQAQAEIVIKRYKPTVDAATAATARQALTAEQAAAFARSQAAAIAETNRRMRESIPAAQAKMSEEDRLSNTLANQIAKLKAQKEFLSDPVYRQSAEKAAMLKREVDKLNEGIQASTRSTEKHGITWSEVVSKYYLASQAFGVVKNGLLSLVDAAKQYDSIRSRLNAAEGSAALGGQDFKEAQEMAKRPGLGFEQVATTMATLRGMKVTAGEAKQLILGIGQANASAAGSAEQFGRVMYQIQQSVSLGRLMAEDLRPIVQQIPTLGAAINNTFGTTSAEALNKRLKESGQSVRDFWLEVSELGAKLPASGDTIQNGLDNLGDAFVRLKAAISPSKETISEFANWLTSKMDRFSAFWEKAGGEKDLAKRAALNTGINLLRMSAADEKILAAEIARIKEYEKVSGLMLRAEQEAESKIAAAAAAKKRREEGGEKAGESEAKRIARHNRESAKNVIFSGPNEVTMRDSGEPDPEHLRNVQGAERSREAREKRDLEDTQKMRANAQKIRMDWESALIEKKRQAHEEEMKLIRERFDVGQKLASDQVYKMLQGEFTIRGAVNATKDVMFRAFADTTTKWIEEQLIKMIFAKGAQAEETASAVAQASAVGAAWAAPSMATSIATFGGSTATGSAAWFTAMTAAQGYSVMPHDRGGAVFGPVNASREEAFAPFVPGRIIPSYNSTTNHNTTNAQSITIHVHGGDEKTILRTLRKAGINGAGVSRS